MKYCYIYIITIFVYCFLYFSFFLCLVFLMLSRIIKMIKSISILSHSLSLFFSLYQVRIRQIFTHILYNSCSSSNNSNNGILSHCITHSPQGTIRIINENNFNALRTCNFLRNVLQPRAKIPVSNFYSLYSPYQQDNHRATTLKDKYRIKNTRIPSQYNFQLHTKIPFVSPSLGGNSIYIFISRQINNSKPNTHEKYNFRTAPKILRSRQRTETV